MNKFSWMIDSNFPMFVLILLYIVFNKQTIIFIAFLQSFGTRLCLSIMIKYDYVSKNIKSHICVQFTCRQFLGYINFDLCNFNITQGVQMLVPTLHNNTKLVYTRSSGTESLWNLGTVCRWNINYTYKLNMHETYMYVYK